MSTLSYEQITAILAENAAQERKAEPDAKYPKPIQVGPLKYHEKSERCSSRGCGSPTHISIQGVRRCPSHALYELNRLIIAQDPILDSRVKDCTCNAGRHSVGNCHTSDCATYIQISLDKSEVMEVIEEQSGNSSSRDSELPGEL